MNHKMNPYNMNAKQSKEEESKHAEEADLPTPEMPEIEDTIDINSQEKTPNEQPAQECVDAKAEIEDMRLRMAAEMDNFKKRLNREHQEQMRYAAEKVLSDLLPALDNLDMAIQYGSTHEACKNMMQGIEMTRKQLLEAVNKNGLVSVGEDGEEFNPAIHEAIGMEVREGLPKGSVSRVMQRGYKLNDRLLRPAKVMVNN